MVKQFYFKQFNLACHSFAFSLNVKPFYLTHGYDPIRVLPLQARMDLGVMARKPHSVFPRVSGTGAIPSDCLVLYAGYSLGVFSILGRDTVGLLYSFHPNQPTGLMDWIG